MMCRDAGVEIWTHILEARTLKILRGHNWARFRTTIDLDRKYLRNGSRYRQSENAPKVLTDV